MSKGPCLLPLKRPPQITCLLAVLLRMYIEICMCSSVSILAQFLCAGMTAGMTDKKLAIAQHVEKTPLEDAGGASDH